MEPNRSVLFPQSRIPRDDDIVIAVLGETGCGKSSFVSLCADTSIDIGHDLKSCTRDMSTYEFTYKSRRVFLVDTPGFDDSERSDADILRTLSHWLTATYAEHNIRLSGLVYLHRINQTRMRGSAVKRTSLFKNLCGDDALAKVILVTTFWDVEDQVIAKQRQGELTETRQYWGQMVARGSKVLQHDNSKPSAMAIIDFFLQKESKVTLAIQEEMVRDGKSLDQTAAGQTVESLLAEQENRFRKELEEVVHELREATKSKDTELADMMKELQLEHKRDLNQVLESQQKLRISMERLHEERYAELERRLEQTGSGSSRPRSPETRDQPISGVANERQEIPIYGLEAGERFLDTEPHNLFYIRYIKKEEVPRREIPIIDISNGHELRGIAQEHSIESDRGRGKKVHVLSLHEFRRGNDIWLQDFPLDPPWGSRRWAVSHDSQKLAKSSQPASGGKRISMFTRNSSPNDRVWSLVKSAEIPVVSPRHRLKFSPSGKYVGCYTSRVNGFVVLDATSLEIKIERLGSTPHSDSSILSSHARFLFAQKNKISLHLSGGQCYQDQSIEIWTSIEPESSRTLTIPQSDDLAPGPMRAICLSDDGKYLVLWSLKSQLLKVLDLTDGQICQTIKAPLEKAKSIRGAFVESSYRLFVAAWLCHGGGEETTRKNIKLFWFNEQIPYPKSKVETPF